MNFIDPMVLYIFLHFYNLMEGWGFNFMDLSLMHRPHALTGFLRGCWTTAKYAVRGSNAGRFVSSV